MRFPSVLETVKLGLKSNFILNEDPAGMVVLESILLEPSRSMVSLKLAPTQVNIFA